MMPSCIYRGFVQHKRFVPVQHLFKYSLCFFYLDLDELNSFFKKKLFFSLEKFNIVSFFRKDHYGTSKDLKAEIQELVFQETGLRSTGKVYLLTHLRYFGYCFNPICVYYLYNEKTYKIEAIVAEVSNTPWGEKCCYTFLVRNTAAIYSYKIDKKMHVSPLMDMDFIYEFYFKLPKEDLFIHIKSKNKSNNIEYFNANMHLTKKEATFNNLTIFFLQYAFITFKVIIAIHWQALVLWLKGAKFYTHPKKRNLQ
jgi:DUF1365 family protein